MKKKLLQSFGSICLFCSMLLAMPGCIDKKYDLSNISTDNTSVGGELTIPLTKINIPLVDIFDFSAMSKLAYTIDLPAVFPLQTLEISEGFDQGIVDKLGDGDLALISKITHTIPVSLYLTVEFVIPGRSNLRLLTDVLVKKSTDGPTKIETNLTKEELEQIVATSEILVGFKTQDGNSHPGISLNSDDAILIALSLQTSGGIKL